MQTEDITKPFCAPRRVPQTPTFPPRNSKPCESCTCPHYTPLASSLYPCGPFSRSALHHHLLPTSPFFHSGLPVSSLQEALHGSCPPTQRPGSGCLPNASTYPFSLCFSFLLSALRCRFCPPPGALVCMLLLEESSTFIMSLCNGHEHYLKKPVETCVFGVIFCVLSKSKKSTEQKAHRIQAAQSLYQCRKGPSGHMTGEGTEVLRTGAVCKGHSAEWGIWGFWLHPSTTWAFHDSLHVNV